MRKAIKKITSYYRAILISSGIALFYWLFESLITFITFEERGYISHLIYPEYHELWMRLLGTFIIFVSSIIIQRTLTKHKKSEERLAKLSNELENVVEKRTEELKITVNELRKLKSILEQRVEQKTRAITKQINRRILYTRALVHELKTPISPLLVSSNLLCSIVNTKGDESLIQLAQNINNAINNLSRRIDELLDFAKYEMGILELKYTKTDFVQLVGEVVSLVTPKAKVYNITINTKLPKTLPHINCDKDRLQQVLLNLLDNAIKYTPKNGSIMLSAKKRDSGILCEVIDNGIGIDNKQQRVIFDFYSKISNKEKGLSGLGLGLPLSKMIIEKHGGKMYCKSEEEKGSNFAFWLPYYKPTYKVI